MLKKINALHVKVFLLLTGIFSNYQTIVERFDETDNIKFLLAYILMYCALLFVAIGTAFIRNNIIRIIYGLIYFFSFLSLDVYARTTGEFLGYPNFISMIKATGFISEAINQYHHQLLSSFAVGLLIFVGISLPGKMNDKFPQPLLISAPPVSVLALSLLMFTQGGDGGKALPSMFTPLSYSSLYMYEKLNNQQGKRLAITILPQHTSQVSGKDIVFVIDESVRGDFLDINSDYGIKSTLQIQSNQWRVINFGLAASVTTCSSEVNVNLNSA